MSPAPKKAAIDLDKIGDKRLSEISAADFLRVLEAQGGAVAQPLEELTVRDAIGLPEKKKVELEKPPGFEQVFDPTVIERLNTTLSRIEAELAKRPQ